MLFRGLIYSIIFFFLIIVYAVIVLEYFFPAEEVRAIAERTLSKKLKLPLKIQKIGFSLLSGMRINGVTLGSASQPLAHVKKVILDCQTQAGKPPPGTDHPGKRQIECRSMA